MLGIHFCPVRTQGSVPGVQELGTPQGTRQCPQGAGAVALRGQQQPQRSWEPRPWTVPWSPGTPKFLFPQLLCQRRR